MNSERRSKIIEMLEENATVQNSEIMERFGVSIETVRRDLAYLEKRGALERVYGGAVRRNFMNSEPEYIRREKTNEQEKNALAAAAQALIDKNDTVFFDLGTTVLQVARQLDENKNIKAFTNSLRAAVLLSEKCCEVFVSGGRLRGGELATSGSVAERNMEMFNMDKAFIGVGGISENGITDFNDSEAYLRKQAIKNASRVIVICDHTKFAVRAMCNVCPITDIDILITDTKAPRNTLKAIEKQGVKIITV